MKYIDAFKCISADYQRYEELYSGEAVRKLN